MVREIFFGTISIRTKFLRRKELAVLTVKPPNLNMDIYTLMSKYWFKYSFKYLLIIFMISISTRSGRSKRELRFSVFVSIEYIYRSGTVNSNTVNSKFHLIRSYWEIFFYHFPVISC